MYSRVGPQNVPLDATGMRNAFFAADSMRARLRKWKQARTEAIEEAYRPFLGQTKAPPLLALHSIPIASLQTPLRFEAAELERAHIQGHRTRSFDGAISDHLATSHRINLDGLYSSTKALANGRPVAYTQAYRSGIVECVLQMNPLLATTRHRTSLAGDPVIYTIYEHAVLRGLAFAMKALSSLGLSEPCLVYLSIFNVRGYKLATPKTGPTLGSPIDRKNVVLGSVVMNQWPTSLFECMKPAFNSVWNACGLERSQNYNDNGKWIGGKIEGLSDP